MSALQWEALAYAVAIVACIALAGPAEWLVRVGRDMDEAIDDLLGDEL